jgi:hypothetical protein
MADLIGDYFLLLIFWMLGLQYQTSLLSISKNVGAGFRPKEPDRGYAIHAGLQSKYL